jgi:prevent-host-death family protein
MIRTRDITSVSEHRERLKDHLQQVHRTGRPMFITTNGQTDAVLLSPVAYDRLVEQAELAESLRVIDQGMAEVAAGLAVPAKAALAAMAKRHGGKLVRKRAKPGKAGRAA